MFTSLVLLSASVVATPVFISEVKAAREAGHLRVDVRGDGGIDPEMVRTVIDDGQLLIYLGGTRVKADNRAWDLEDGRGEIRAHRHRNETELVVPLDGNGCAGPVELAGSESGITALVGCDGSVATTPGIRIREEAPRAPKVSQARTVARLERPVEPTEVGKVSAQDERQDERIRALVALPPPATPVAAILATPPTRSPEVVPLGRVASASVAPVVLPRVASATSVPAVAPTPTPAPTPTLKEEGPSTGSTVAVKPSVPPRVESVIATSAAPASASAPSGGAAGGLRTVAVPALLLGALAVAAYFFAKRRRATLEHHIQIVETASLGPKRSLVIARVGNETLILGTSEAGITLLKSTTRTDDGGQTLGEPVDDSSFEISQPLEEALADIPEPGDDPAVAHRGGFKAIEGGLASLFGARAAYAGNRANDQHDQHDQKDVADGFGELLEDSVEDQELRQKLAAGLSARVR